MPNFDNLKKQAKQVLRWHRDRYFPVTEQIRTYLPRYQHLSDTEILALAFQLSDAQELVARQHGFDSWQALKAGISAVLDRPERNTPKAVITCAEPQLFVADVNASCDFFRQKLGFSIAFIYGEPPYYAQVSRDSARLNIRCATQLTIDPAVRDREALLSASMTVATANEIKLLFLEFQSAGATFYQTLKHQPWGARNFVVKDLDGNLLLFAGPAD